LPGRADAIPLPKNSVRMDKSDATFEIFEMLSVAKTDAITTLVARVHRWPTPERHGSISRVGPPLNSAWLVGCEGLCGGFSLFSTASARGIGFVALGVASAFSDWREPFRLSVSRGWVGQGNSSSGFLNCHLRRLTSRLAWPVVPTRKPTDAPEKKPPLKKDCSTSRTPSITTADGC
jgi:hypothetical protein